MLRWLLGACLAIAALAPGAAGASVSIQVTWEALLHDSSDVAVVVPVESQSVWENGRIYTYTHVRVERPVAGDLATGADAWVRTMGGVVGKIGQLVEGEAVLAVGHESLLFLHHGPAGAYLVTARGQGQFPIMPGEAPGAPRHVVRGTSTGALVAPHATPLRLAADVVHGRLVDDVARDVQAAWSRTHAR